MQEFDYGRIAFFSDGKVYDIIMGERMPKLQEKKKTNKFKKFEDRIWVLSTTSEYTKS